MRTLLTALTALSLLFTGTALAAKYKGDGDHTVALFKIKHLNVANFYGRFNKVEAKIEYDADPAKNSVEITIDVESVDTANAKRDKHLRSPDFFNAKQNPKLTFKSKAWKKTSDTAFDVTGDLTINGTTKEVTVPVVKTGEGADPWGGQRIGFETTFTIKRGEYGITFMPGGLSEEVQIILTLEGIKE